MLVEKLEDAKARAAIKAQIEADKRERAERTAREKALREGRPITDNMAGQPSAPAVSAPSAGAAGGSTGVAGRDFKETRLQIRMANGGQPYTTTLPSEASKFNSNAASKKSHRSPLFGLG
jgi:UBX domain-containing protein 1/4